MVYNTVSSISRRITCPKGEAEEVLGIPVKNPGVILVPLPKGYAKKVQGTKFGSAYELYNLASSWRLEQSLLDTMQP